MIGRVLTIRNVENGEKNKVFGGGLPWVGSFLSFDCSKNITVVEKWWKSLRGSLWETVWESLRRIVENRFLHIFRVEKLSFARGSGKVLRGVLHMEKTEVGRVFYTISTAPTTTTIIYIEGGQVKEVYGN